jgi:hypothetical protein
MVLLGLTPSLHINPFTHLLNNPMTQRLYDLTIYPITHSIDFLLNLQSKILNPLDAMPACRKCSIVGGRYAILRKGLFFSKKFTNCGARPGKGRVSKTTPLLGDIPTTRWRLLLPG